MNLYWMSLALFASLGLSAWLRPWRMLGRATLWTPLLATLVLLPWFWALPRLHEMPLQLQLSGAPLVLLCLGWPLAMWALAGVAGLSWVLAPLPLEDLLRQWFHLGFCPATLALGLGHLLRRHLPTHPFIYILGRGFLGTALCVFASGVLQTALWDSLPPVSTGLSLVAQWLMAWGDAFLTGLLTAILVAFRPGWLATWSDALYLAPPSAPDA